MPPLPAAVEVAAFRAGQEALTNVARHAHARHAVLSIEVGDTLRLEVRDDGCGLAPSHRAGVGLTSMRERATELGGHVEISTLEAGGTLVQMALPLVAGQATEVRRLRED